MSIYNYLGTELQRAYRSDGSELSKAYNIENTEIWTKHTQWDIRLVGLDLYIDEAPSACVRIDGNELILEDAS